MGRGFAEAGRREGEAARARGTCLELATHSPCAGTNHILSQGLFPRLQACPSLSQGPPQLVSTCCLESPPPNSGLGPAASSQELPGSLLLASP